VLSLGVDTELSLMRSVDVFQGFSAGFLQTFLLEDMQNSILWFIGNEIQSETRERTGYIDRSGRHAKYPNRVIKG